MNARRIGVRLAADLGHDAERQGLRRHGGGAVTCLLVLMAVCDQSYCVPSRAGRALAYRAGVLSLSRAPVAPLDMSSSDCATRDLLAELRLQRRLGKTGCFLWSASRRH